MFQMDSKSSDLPKATEPPRGPSPGSKLEEDASYLQPPDSVTAQGHPCPSPPNGSLAPTQSGIASEDFLEAAELHITPNKHT